MEELRPRRRYYLSKKELKSFEKEISNTWLLELMGPLRSRKVERAVFDRFDIYVIDSIPCLVNVESLIFPTLYCLLRLNVKGYPSLVVDRGATLALARGADLMAPGVRGVRGTFSLGDIVVAIDEDLEKPVAVLRALMNSDKIKALVESKGKGKVAKNVHRPNDIIWKASRYLS